MRKLTTNFKLNLYSTYPSIYFQNIPFQSHIEINSASKQWEWELKNPKQGFKTMCIQTFFSVNHWNSNDLIFSLSTKDKEIQIIWFLAFQQRTRNLRVNTNSERETWQSFNHSEGLDFLMRKL